MTEMTDNEKKFYDSMKAFASEGKTITEAITQIVKDIDDVKKIPDALSAVQTLQEEAKASSDDVTARLARAERAAYGAGGRYRGHAASEDTARACGLHLLSKCSKEDAIRQRAADALKSEHKDFHQRAHSAGSLSSGAALVVPEFESGLEHAESEYGVAKTYLRRKTMGNSDELTTTIRTGRPKVYIWGEGEAPKASEMNLAQVSLKVQNWATLAFFPIFLNEDSAVNLAEEIFDWFGEGFAYQFDFITFTGDASKAAFGKRGVIPKWLQLNKKAVHHDAAVNTYADLTEDHYLAMLAKLTRAARGNARWFTSAEHFLTTMVPIALSKGGVTFAEMQGGIQPQFLGKPVEFAEVIGPDDTHLDHEDNPFRAPVAVGDLGRAGAWADRKQVGFMTNDNVKWLEGQTAVMGVQRTDVNFADTMATEEGKSAMSVLKVNPAA